MKTQQTILIQVSLAITEIRQMLGANPHLSSLTYRIEGATASELKTISLKYASALHTSDHEPDSWTSITIYNPATDQQAMLVIYGEKVVRTYTPAEQAQLN